MTVSLHRRTLIHIADEGRIESPDGKLTRLLADALGSNPDRVRAVLNKALEAGEIDAKHCAITGRYFRVELTTRGRVAIGREQNFERKVKREEVAVTAPPMPQLGPIRKHRFDPEKARERAAGAA